MKKMILSTCLMLIVFTSLSFAQTERLDYKKIDYIRVDQDKTDQFLKKVRDEMKPAYQNMVDSGDIRSWELYLVDYPGGQRSEYNFVCVVTAPEILIFEDKFSKIGSSYFMPVSDSKNGSGDLNAMATLVASEIWKVRSKLSKDTTKTDPSRYMSMDYMNVPENRGLEYLMLEDEVAMPLHRERKKREQMAGWEVYSLIIPGGTEYGYNFATGNFFEHISHIEYGFTQEIIKQTLPGTNVTDLLNTISKTRDLVKSELWELGEYAN